VIHALSGEYAVPPRLHNGQGEVRRVGLEVELGGLDLGDAAAVVARACGETVHADDPQMMLFAALIDAARAALRARLSPTGN
jgi:hypothetical protein